MAARCGLSCGISGTPIPADLGKTLPYAVIYSVGGFKTSKVVDTHTVSIDVYDERWDLAMAAASKLSGIVEFLVDTDGLSVDYHSTATTSLPYNNPDPRHSDLPRVTFTADVVLKSAAI